MQKFTSVFEESGEQESQVEDGPPTTKRILISEAESDSDKKIPVPGLLIPHQRPYLASDDGSESPSPIMPSWNKPNPSRKMKSEAFPWQ